MTKLSALVAGIASGVILAWQIRAQDYTCTITNREITIARCRGFDPTLTIPKKINGLPVTRIGDRAFYASSGLQGVIIRDCVITIGSEAFRHCTSLSDLRIGNRVMVLGEYAFDDCTNLRHVTPPAA